MDPDLVLDLTEQLQDHRAPEVSVIFAGVDQDGPATVTGPLPHPHIYLADGPEITCQDRVGFAAIGIGASHSESQFMYVGHTVEKPLIDTLLTTYIAKRRAEIAPGVGKETDMFAIGPGLGTYFKIGDHVVEGLVNIGKRYDEKAAEARAAATAEMYRFNEELMAGTKDTNPQLPPRGFTQ